MIIFNKEVAEAILIGKERVAALYLGVENRAVKIWEGIQSCFGSGRWLGKKPWRGKDKWKKF